MIDRPYKRHFVSFADSRMKASLDRIRKQARDMDCYDYISALNEKDLDPSFEARFRRHLVLGSRGFGYWCWKPQVILQELEKLAPGGVLQYTDAGCHLNPKGRKRLVEYFDIAHREGILGFQSRAIDAVPLGVDGHFFPDYRWIKGDVLDYFNIRDRKDMLETGTVGATIIFICKSPAAINIIEKWRQVYVDDFSLLTDSPSRSPDPEGFIEHRHDQAIWSVLCKLHKITTLSACEYFPSSRFAPTGSDGRRYNGDDWSMFKNYPILAKRDKGGLANSSKSERIIRRLLRLARNLISKSFRFIFSFRL